MSETELFVSDNDPKVAVFDNQAAATPGATGIPFQAKSSRKSDAQPNETSEREEKAGRVSQSVPQQEDDDELPEQGDSREVPARVLKRLRVCFYHAMELRCSYTVGGNHSCRFSGSNGDNLE